MIPAHRDVMSIVAFLHYRYFPFKLQQSFGLIAPGTKVVGSTHLGEDREQELICGEGKKATKGWTYRHSVILRVASQCKDTVQSFTSSCQPPPP